MAEGVRILEVGPALTFAMREGMFALAHIEEELLYGTDIEPSGFIAALDEAMLADDKHWKKHYQGTELEIRMKRKYSFSDRCRYYMPTPSVEEAKERLIGNLRQLGIPLNLLSQFIPIQSTTVSEGLLENTPHALVAARMMHTMAESMTAPHKNELSRPFKTNK